jgi:ribosomal RNA-processing protein 9
MQYQYAFNYIVWPTLKKLTQGLSFRRGGHQLYSASFDRTIKVYDLSPSVMGYVETLFGHQDQILSIDSLRSETCVTVGGQDKTARFWKIADETQLVFRGGGRSKLKTNEPEDCNVSTDVKPAIAAQFAEGSLECIAMIDEGTFVTGGNSG